MDDTPPTPTPVPDRPARVLYVKVAGFWAMLAAWFQRRSVFRALTEWSADATQVTLYAPVVDLRAYRRSLQQVGDTRMASPTGLIAQLIRYGADGLDLWLHEAWWHGTRKNEAHTPKGLGSGNMAVRDTTTTVEERSLAVREFEGAWDAVVLHGRI